MTQAKLTGSQIRRRFLDYFAQRGHVVVPSSSLIPHNDPTLLFANAGMNQFKDCFLGMEDRGYYRAASSQKCVRAGGKHNDLENVGRTARHHTFFEMLGNFSFGDYFKKEAIAYAWECLTVEMGLDKSRLYVSVYTEDDEAADIWHQQEGVPRERIFRFGEKDNFWSMGDTGPCGPCTEIFYDNGPEVGCDDPNCTVGCDCDRYMEIWNNVFMQFDRQPGGALVPLPKPAVDTGMGLERITTVMQGVTSNYDTDLLQGIIRFVEKLSGKRYRDNDKDDVSMRVIADHIRAITFLICDGALPSNEGRGYVLRRIMRRAARHAKMLGFADPVLYRMVDAVRDIMGEAYPQLGEREEYIKKVVRAEEERFAETLDRGLAILNDAVAGLKREQKTVIPGDTLFQLYDTYGFPTDLTADIVRVEGFGIDEEGFEACMERQRAQSREHWKGSGEEGIAAVYKTLHNQGVRSAFSGYGQGSDYSVVSTLLINGAPVAGAQAGDQVEVITEATPFYGASGGQVGDTGNISSGSAHLKVLDTLRPFADLIVHRALVESGTLRTGDAVDLTVDTGNRLATARNHTATHLLQAALRDVLGDHVKQAGSLVEPERLRFDFTHFTAMTSEEIRQVEQLVNRHTMANAAVDAREMALDEAINCGATALFGEKYGDRVRVVRVGEVSMELCGGTHVSAAGDIGLFKIVQETGIAAGVRRIEAVTGERAVALVQEQEDTLERLANLVKSDRTQLESRLLRLVERQKDLERELEQVERRAQAGQADSILDRVREIGGVKVLVTAVAPADGKGLREMADRLRDKLVSGVVVIGCPFDGKANLLVAVTKDLIDRLHAGELVAAMAAEVGGRGGGRPDLAQAGGTRPERLDAALAKADALITRTLAG
jgi:alanyl-tRNA synthetase